MYSCNRNLNRYRHAHNTKYDLFAMWSLNHANITIQKSWKRRKIDSHKESHLVNMIFLKTSFQMWLLANFGPDHTTHAGSYRHFSQSDAWDSRLFSNLSFIIVSTVFIVKICIPVFNNNSQGCTLDLLHFQSNVYDPSIKMHTLGHLRIIKCFW
jgi:hypothetical protein